MKQYKRIISLLIVMATLASAVPQVMAADAEVAAQSAVVYSTEVSETAVAVVNGIEYDSLEAAISAASANSVITLYKDVVLAKK